MAPRKSTRLSTKVARQDQDGDCASEGGKEESEGEEERARQKKKSKTTAKKGKGKSGGASGGAPSKNKNKLEVFNSMPLDVLVEIMAQSDPKTLLAMSRTCSIFRQVLHSEGGLSAWKSARRNVGLGELQRRDITEWEIAQLLFDGTCVVCGKTRAVTIDYVLFVRGCANCMRENSLRKLSFNAGKYHKRVFECVSHSLWSPPFSNEPMQFWWLPMLARVTKQLKALESDPAALQSFVDLRKDIQAQAEHDKRIMESWVARQKFAEANAKEGKKTARYDKIKEKLRLEGYEDVDLKCSALSTHADVKNGRELTENVWKRIKPILSAVVDEERTKRLEREAKERRQARARALLPFYKGIQQSLPPLEESEMRVYFPSFANFHSLSSVKPLYLPEGYVVNDADLATAKPLVLEELTKYPRVLPAMIRTKILAAYTELDPSFEPSSLDLSLCTSAIKCAASRPCGTYSTFPSILGHSRTCDEYYWTLGKITTTPLQIKSIRQIIQAYNDWVDESNRGGGGASSGTGLAKLSEKSEIGELDGLGNTFECVPCARKYELAIAKGYGAWYSNDQKTKELSWNVLLDHILSKHATPGEALSLKYTPTPTPAPADVPEHAEEEQKEGEKEHVHLKEEEKA